MGSALTFGILKSSHSWMLPRVAILLAGIVVRGVSMASHWGGDPSMACCSCAGKTPNHNDNCGISRTSQ